MDTYKEFDVMDVIKFKDLVSLETLYGPKLKIEFLFILLATDGI